MMLWMIRRKNSMINCRLQSTDKVIRILPYSWEILMQTGDVNTGYEQVMGIHGLGRRNENKNLFADFFAQNSLAIGGSVFEHRCIHKAMWRSPDHVTENQSDHVCICQRFRQSLQDVRVK